MAERVGEERPVTRANVAEDSEASSFHKFSIRAIACACECDQLIFRDQRNYAVKRKRRIHYQEGAHGIRASNSIVQ